MKQFLESYVRDGMDVDEVIYLIDLFNRDFATDQGRLERILHLLKSQYEGNPHLPWINYGNFFITPDARYSHVRFSEGGLFNGPMTKAIQKVFTPLCSFQPGVNFLAGNALKPLINMFTVKRLNPSYPFPFLLTKPSHYSTLGLLSPCFAQLKMFPNPL